MEITPFQGFASYQPLIADIPSAPYSTGADISVSKNDSKKETKDKGIGGLSESMINRLLDHGLKSDVQSFLYRMGDAINHAYDPVTGQPDLSAYMLLIPELVQIKNNHDEYEEARKQLLSKKAINDYAMTPDGAVCVAYLDDNQQMIQRWMSVPDVLSQFKDNMGSIHILTNGELAKYRSENIQMAFNQDIVNILAGATGMQDITEFIRTEAPKLGTSSQKSTFKFGSAGATEFKDSVEALQDLISGGAKESHTIKEQTGQAALAINYLTSIMPENMKAQLSLRAAKQNQTATSIIASYFGAGMNFEKEDVIDLGSSKSQQTDVDKLKMTAPMMWAQGYGVSKDIYWNTNNTTFALPLHTVMGTITSQNKPIGTYTTLTDVAKSDFGTLLDVSKASFAGVQVDPVMGNNVLVNSGELYKVKLPLDQEALALGIIKPDMALLDKLQLAEQEIVYRHITDAESINAIYAREGLPVEYSVDAQGNRSYKFTGPSATFGAMTAYMPQQAFISKDQMGQLTAQAVSIVDEAKRKEIEKLLKSQVAKEGQTSFDGSTGWFEDDLYQSMIYIPINEHWAAQMGTNSSAEMPSIKQAKDILEPLQQQSDRQKQLQSIIKPQI